MTLALEIVLDGDPRAKGRPRFGGGRTFTPRSTKDAEKAVGWDVKKQWRGPALTCPVRVDLAFYTRTRRRVDVDNLAKLVLDALNEIVWVDDRQVVFLHAEKFHDPERPRTEITVHALHQAAA